MEIELRLLLLFFLAIFQVDEVHSRENESKIQEDKNSLAQEYKIDKITKFDKYGRPVRAKLLIRHGGVFIGKEAIIIPDRAISLFHEIEQLGDYTLLEKKCFTMSQLHCVPDWMDCRKEAEVKFGVWKNMVGHLDDPHFSLQKTGYDGNRFFLTIKLPIVDKLAESLKERKYKNDMGLIRNSQLWPIMPTIYDERNEVLVSRLFAQKELLVMRRDLPDNIENLTMRGWKSTFLQPDIKVRMVNKSGGVGQFYMHPYSDISKMGNTWYLTLVVAGRSRDDGEHQGNGRLYQSTLRKSFSHSWYSFNLLSFDGNENKILSIVSPVFMSEYKFKNNPISFKYSREAVVSANGLGYMQANASRIRNSTGHEGGQTKGSNAKSKDGTYQPPSPRDPAQKPERPPHPNLRPHPSHSP